VCNKKVVAIFCKYAKIICFRIYCSYIEIGIISKTSMLALGASIGFPALYIAALSGMKPGEEGLASGIIATSQRVGFPLGLAILISVASAVGPQTIAGYPPATVDMVVMGFRYAFLIATVMSLIGLLLVFRIRDKKPLSSQLVVS
jgi:hypothetical protein